MADKIKHTPYPLPTRRESYGKFGEIEGPRRMYGETTRLIDAAIQTLFTTGTVEVRDHADMREAHINISMRILNRLRAEHRLDRSNEWPGTGLGLNVAINGNTGVHTLTIYKLDGRP